MHPSIAPLGTYKSQFASEHQFRHSQMPLSGTTPCMNNHKIDPIYHERSRILNWLLIIYDNPSRSAVSKRILPPIPLLHHPLCILNHPQSISPSKNVGLYLQGLWPLSVISQRHAGHAQDACLLLHSARVGQRQPETTCGLCVFF